MRDHWAFLNLSFEAFGELCLQQDRVVQKLELDFEKVGQYGQGQSSGQGGELEQQVHPGADVDLLRGEEEEKGEARRRHLSRSCQEIHGPGHPWSSSGESRLC